MNLSKIEDLWKCFCIWVFCALIVLFADITAIAMIMAAYEGSIFFGVLVMIGVGMIAISFNYYLLKGLYNCRKCLKNGGNC